MPTNEQQVKSATLKTRLANTTERCKIFDSTITPIEAKINKLKEFRKYLHSAGKSELFDEIAYTELVKLLSDLKEKRLTVYREYHDAVRQVEMYKELVELEDAKSAAYAILKEEQ